MGYMREARAGDDAEVLRTLRQADREEIKAVTGAPAELVLPLAFECPGKKWTLASPEDQALALVGVSPVLGEPLFGTIWMLASDNLLKHQVSFLRQSKGALRVVHEDYEVLTNFVDARNTLHIRWLRWLGFKFLRRVERYGAESRPFYEFARIKN